MTKANKNPFRHLIKEEVRILDTLLKQNFKGRNEIQEQINQSLVRSTGCSCGCLSIEIVTESQIVVPNTERVPVEASYLKNNKPYQILLHVWNGKVIELEFVSYDGDGDDQYPASDQLTVTINEKTI